MHKPMMARAHLAAAGAALLLGAPALQAAPGDERVKPLPATEGKASLIQPRTTSLPAKGLFDGEQLSAAARARLSELIVNALGLRVEVALIVPTGPWKLADKGQRERDLTPARLQAVRQFLAERGVDPKQIFVESRIDKSLTEPRLDVQIMGRPAID